MVHARQEKTCLRRVIFRLTEAGPVVAARGSADDDDGPSGAPAVEGSEGPESGSRRLRGLAGLGWWCCSCCCCCCSICRGSRARKERERRQLGEAIGGCTWTGLALWQASSSNSALTAVHPARSRPTVERALVPPSSAAPLVQGQISRSLCLGHVVAPPPTRHAHPAASSSLGRTVSIVRPCARVVVQCNRVVVLSRCRRLLKAVQRSVNAHDTSVPGPPREQFVP